jgi:hypothetical protein
MSEGTTTQAAPVQRAARDTQTRDSAVRGLQERNPEEFRKYQWKPADALPMPVAPPGWHYRYIRKSIGAEQDVNNFGRAMREGWVTVPLSDHPELIHSIDPSAKNSGLIEIGALVLCKIPLEVKQARDAYFAQMNARQIEAVDSNLMRENNPKMPLFNNRKSEVSFGNGS